MKPLVVASVALLVVCQADAVIVVEQTPSEPNGGRVPSINQNGADQSGETTLVENGGQFLTTSPGQGTGLADKIATSGLNLPVTPGGSQLVDALLLAALVASPIAGFAIGQIVKSTIVRRRVDREMARTTPHLGGTWSNRVRYTSSLAATAKVFVSSGLITQKQADAILSAAASSSREKESVAVPPDTTPLQPTAILLTDKSTGPVQSVKVLPQSSRNR
jgi:hypothetical protein